jgi:hypothetical protein
MRTNNKKSLCNWVLSFNSHNNEVKKNQLSKLWKEKSKFLRCFSSDTYKIQNSLCAIVVPIHFFGCIH